MDEAIRQRCLDVGQYMLRHSTTLRGAARAFGLSKSSVHKDMSRRLPQINPALAAQVAVLIQYNKSVRHLRGGAATKRRWERSVSSAAR